MEKKLYIVRASVVRRITTQSQVFAESGAEAERLVQSGLGERVGRREVTTVEQPTFDAKLDKGAKE